jgi:hypothetical protein
MRVDRRPVWRIPAFSSASYTRPSSKTCSMRDFRGSSAAWDEAIAGAIHSRDVQIFWTPYPVDQVPVAPFRRGSGILCIFEAIKPNCTARSISVDTQTYPSRILRLSLLSSHFLRCYQMQKRVECVQTPSLIPRAGQNILHRIW